MLIQQRTPSDCTLACIAMAAGKAFDDLWAQADLDKLVEDRGCRDADVYLQRAGFALGTYLTVYTYHSDNETVRALLWKRRAILSVPSLNIENGYHHVYWDGDTLFDPSTKRTYQYLSSLYIKSAIIFLD